MSIFWYLILRGKQKKNKKKLEHLNTKIRSTFNGRIENEATELQLQSCPLLQIIQKNFVEQPDTRQSLIGGKIMMNCENAFFKNTPISTK